MTWRMGGVAQGLSLGCFHDGVRDIRSQASVHSICSNDGININQQSGEESFGLRRLNSHQQAAPKEAAKRVQCEIFFPELQPGAERLINAGAFFSFFFFVFFFFKSGHINAQAVWQVTWICAALKCVIFASHQFAGAHHSDSPRLSASWELKEGLLAGPLVLGIHGGACKAAGAKLLTLGSRKEKKESTKKGLPEVIFSTSHQEYHRFN